MFDIGFWELSVIAILGLVVLGPERLPGALRTVIGWVRQVRGLATSVKEDISQELRLHELQKDLKKAEQQGMTNLAPELQQSVDELKKAAESVQRPYSDDNKPQKSLTKETGND